MIENLFKIDHLVVVDKYNSQPDNQKNANYWSHDEVKEIKQYVKKELIKHQDYTCSYCRQKYASDNLKVWELEHVLPRSKFPKFMFEPDNLCAICPDCNTNKGNKKVSKSESYKSYPRKSSSYDIIHPKYDVYNEHIHHNNYIYLSKTKKGRLTIGVCNLHRFSENYINWSSVKEVTELNEQLDMMHRKGIDVDKIKKLIELVTSM